MGTINKRKIGIGIAVVFATIFVLVALFFASLKAGVRINQFADRKVYAALKPVWDKEAAAVEGRVKAKQAQSSVAGAVKIDLKPYVTASLTDSVPSPKDVKENHLAELPKGSGIYAGVPFDVEGMVQLMGNGLKQYNKEYPNQVPDIKISKTFNKLYILHGASYLNEKGVGNTIAKIIFHYSDGSLHEVPITSGWHVLDWWGPIFETKVGEDISKLRDPDTELAWTGKNPFLKTWKPDWSLRVYKTAFSNPKPNLAVVKADFVSTSTDAAPFLLAMTVE